MKPISIIILFKNDQTEFFKNLQLDCNLETYDRKEVTIFSLNAIIPYNYMGKEIALIISGNEQFLTDYTYEECKKIFIDNS